ncbi:MAG: hypothetical protein GY779_14625, partial [Gammaproteobacteria bacterium]|nr:hypothetical protein [Gammaproteobacteria bacterium]
ANLAAGNPQIIDSEETTLGETWQSCVTPNDGTEDGITKCSNELTIVTDLVVDHILISHDGSALTCTDDTLNIKACANTDCSSVATSDVDITLSATGGTSVWSNNPVTIPANSSSGIDVTLTHRTAETITLSASSSPVASNALVCSPVGCEIAFAEAGFILTLDDHQSCTDQELVIQAVKLSETGTTCAPAYTGSQSVNFSFDYSNPSTGSTVPILDSTNMAAENVVQSRTITFDNTASATLDFEYRDAGQLRITVADNASAGLSFANVDTIVRPAKLIVSTSDANNECTGPDYAADSGDCDVFKVAGTTGNIPSRFNLSVAGACADNTVTPNFQLNSIQLSPAVVAPSGGSSGALAVSNVDITSGGTVSVPQAITEVGVFTITAIPPNYLGQFIPAATSNNIGRFIPHRFTVSGNSPLFTDSTCNFTYQNQAFDFAPGLSPTLTVTAVNSADAITTNYGGDGVSNNDFWKLDGSLLSGRTYIDQVAAYSGTLGISRGSVIVTDETDYDGINAYAFPSDQLTYNKTGVVPVPTNDAAFEATVQLNLAAALLTDSDGVFYDEDDDGTADAYARTITGTEIRWGRWHIANAFGSELQALLMVAEAQYYNGTSFVLNSNDTSTGGCTTYTPFAASLSTYTDNLSSGETALPSPFPNISSGLVTFSLSAPGTGNDGSVLTTITTPSWLTYDFNSDSSADNASATATFGIFEGREPVIIKRQTY